MTCRDVLDFLMDYVSGGLSPEERAIFDAHLAECPPCVAYLHSYQQTIRLGKALASSPQPHSIPEELVQAVLAARREPKA